MSKDDILPKREIKKVTEQYLSTRKTIAWLRKNAKIGNKDLTVDRKFLKYLDDTCRLLPDKKGFLGIGKKYALTHLKQYASDVKPR